MNESLSTRETGWVLGKSAAEVRRMIRDGAIQGVRIPAGFRVPRDEALRLGRERIEGEAGRTVSDRELERLIDEVLETNRAT